MFKIIRQQHTVQRAIREARHHATRNYSKFLHKQPPLNHLKVANVRRMATGAGGSNDAMLIAAGLGVLGITSAVGYYVTNTDYQGPKQEVAPSEESVSEPVEDVPVKEDTPVVEGTESKTEEVEQPVTEATAEESVVEESKPSEESAEAAAEPSTEEVKEQVPIVEESKPKFPEEATYVIIGAGTAAHAACRAIRKNDPNAKILIIGEENALPYMRPPLSKELWFSEEENVGDTLMFKSWNGKERSVFFEKEDYYTNVNDFVDAERAVAVLTGDKVTSIDSDARQVTLGSGANIKYGKLLIATGGAPKEHSAFTNADVKKRTTLFRSIADFQNLNSAVKDAQHVVVVGGGFLGSELACALAAQGKKRGLKVTQIYPEEGNMAKVLPKYLSEWTTQKVSKEGVNIIAKQSVKETSMTANELVKLTLDNGEETVADHIIVCVGLQPNIELAQTAGLEVDTQEGGFRVNSELEARSDIWVAGDAACFYDINLGRRRVEHHDHAVVSGRLAGENMTGAKKSYKHQSMFWSDLGPEVGYEAIGICDSSLKTVGIWAKATESDTPKAAEEATGESVRSDSESENVAGDSSVNQDMPVAATASVGVKVDEESFGKGVVFYTREKKIVGILLWNIFGQMPIARKIVTEGKDHEDLNALAKLFKIH